jgi:uncharacterized membrane protein
MKIETALFGSGVFFFGPIAVIYGIVTSWNEPVGTSALFLTAGLAALIALYFWLTSRRIDPRPEDDPMGQIADSAGDQGHFPPYSWWPLPLALGAAIIFAAFAAGTWMLFIGAAIGAVALVGWVFEYYRGEHAH